VWLGVDLDQQLEVSIFDTHYLKSELGRLHLNAFKGIDGDTLCHLWQ
jgi:hypothetical protein